MKCDSVKFSGSAANFGEVSFRSKLIDACATLWVRFSIEDLEMVEAAAKRAGLSLSTYIRDAAVTRAEREARAGSETA